MNVNLLLELSLLFVEFLWLFSSNALVLLENNSDVLSIGGSVLTNGGKITDILWLVDTCHIPQKHRFQSIGQRAIFKGSTLWRCI